MFKKKISNNKLFFDAESKKNINEEKNHARSLVEI